MSGCVTYGLFAPPFQAGEMKRYASKTKEMPGASACHRSGLMQKMFITLSAAQTGALSVFKFSGSFKFLCGVFLLRNQPS